MLQLQHVAVNEMDEIIPPSDSDDNSFDFTNGNSPLFDNESDDNGSIDILEQIPSFLVDSSAESENDTDTENGIQPVENTDPIDPSNPYALRETDMQNYENDTEHEDDFGNGWHWTFESDRGCSYGPFLGRNILLLDPRKREGTDIFDYLFTPDMWRLLTNSTNAYAAKRLQQTGKFELYLFISVFSLLLYVLQC